MDRRRRSSPEDFNEQLRSRRRRLEEQRSQQSEREAIIAAAHRAYYEDVLRGRGYSPDEFDSMLSVAMASAPPPPSDEEILAAHAQRVEAESRAQLAASFAASESIRQAALTRRWNLTEAEAERTFGLHYIPPNDRAIYDTLRAQLLDDLGGPDNLNERERRSLEMLDAREYQRRYNADLAPGSRQMTLEQALISMREQEAQHRARRANLTATGPQPTAQEDYDQGLAASTEAFWNRRADHALARGTFASHFPPPPQTLAAMRRYWPITRLDDQSPFIVKVAATPELITYRIANQRVPDDFEGYRDSVQNRWVNFENERSHVVGNMLHQYAGQVRFLEGVQNLGGATINFGGSESTAPWRNYLPNHVDRIPPELNEFASQILDNYGIERTVSPQEAAARLRNHMIDRRLYYAQHRNSRQFSGTINGQRFPERMRALTQQDYDRYPWFTAHAATLGRRPFTNVAQMSDFVQGRANMETRHMYLYGHPDAHVLPFLRSALPEAQLNGGDPLNPAFAALGLGGRPVRGLFDLNSPWVVHHELFDLDDTDVLEDEQAGMTSPVWRFIGAAADAFNRAQRGVMSHDLHRTESRAEAWYDYADDTGAGRVLHNNGEGVESVRHQVTELSGRHAGMPRMMRWADAYVIPGTPYGLVQYMEPRAMYGYRGGVEPTRLPSRMRYPEAFSEPTGVAATLNLQPAAGPLRDSRVFAPNQDPNRSRRARLSGYSEFATALPELPAIDYGQEAAYSGTAAIPMPSMIPAETTVDATQVDPHAISRP